MKKFTTSFSETQIDWLRETALAETKKRGEYTTPAKLLQEMVERAINESWYGK